MNWGDGKVMLAWVCGGFAMGSKKVVVCPRARLLLSLVIFMFIANNSIFKSII